MTKEEKLELINKLDTQIDGVEAYIGQLKAGEIGAHKTWLTMTEGTLDALRKEIEKYVYMVNKRG